MKQIILASTSLRRKELLEKIGLKFDIVDSNYIEDLTLNKEPINLVKYLSLGKAMAVVEKYLDSIIISADTIVVYKNKVLGKPKTKKQAREFLGLLSGKTHYVITAFTIIDSKTKNKITKAVPTKITMRKLIPKEIEWYIRSGEPMDKAGAYAIQGLGSIFIKKISGDYFATVGMPVFDIVRELKKFGIDLLKD